MVQGSREEIKEIPTVLDALNEHWELICRHFWDEKK
jgi:hypothetical protein